MYRSALKQTESFTIAQKQQLGYYMLFSSLNEDKKNNLKNSGAENFGKIDMNNLRNDIYSNL